MVGLRVPGSQLGLPNHSRLISPLLIQSPVPMAPRWAARWARPATVRHWGPWRACARPREIGPRPWRWHGGHGGQYTYHRIHWDDYLYIYLHKLIIVDFYGKWVGKHTIQWVVLYYQPKLHALLRDQKSIKFTIHLNMLYCLIPLMIRVWNNPYAPGPLLQVLFLCCRLNRYLNTFSQGIWNTIGTRNWSQLLAIIEKMVGGTRAWDCILYHQPNIHLV